MRRALLVILVLLLPAAPLLGAAVAAPEAPPRAWWEATLLDADGDRLDDGLEPLLTGEAPLTVLVGYAVQPGAREQAAIEAEGFRVSFAPNHFPLLVAEGPAARAASLARLPGVVLVERNDALVPTLKQSAPMVGATAAWNDQRVTGRGVVIAVLDEGTHQAHPDLKDKIVASHNAAAGADAPFGAQGEAPGEDVVTPAGEQGHGTHVAGAAVGTGAESGGDYRGIAPDAKLVDVRVFSGPNQTTSDLVLRGLDWVLDHREELDIRVAVLSLGGRASDGTDALSRAVNVAVDQGLVVVAAAGNTGPGARTVTSPGAAEKAITVAAVDKQKRLASFSSRGPTLGGGLKPDIAAPGVAVVSAVPPASTTGVGGFLGGSRSVWYGGMSGTSMAAPHVAGAAALMLEANPALAPADVKRILLATAQDLGPKGRDNDTGYGFLNAVASVQVARDPALLEDPEFADVLATIPDPPPESWLERLRYERDSLARGSGGLATGVAVGALALGCVLLVGARRR